MKTKSLTQLTEQLYRIQAYKANQSLSRMAYRIWNAYFRNIAIFQMERDKFAGSWEARKKEQIPYSIYGRKEQEEIIWQQQ